MTETTRYTCLEYRQEMQLLALRRRLETEATLTEAERKKIQEEIRRLEAEMDMA